MIRTPAEVDVQSLFPEFPFELVLASSSPRRSELLGHFGLPFRVVVPQIVEAPSLGETATAYALRNACDKAAAVIQQLASETALVVAADTIVVLGESILEKPKDRAEAIRMLQQLSGREHLVYSGVALATHNRVDCRLVETRVRFAPLNDEAIAYYTATPEPYDKAGGYGIQGVGGFMVERIEGSYSNVVGLPLVELAELIRQFCRPVSLR